MDLVSAQLGLGDPKTIINHVEVCKTFMKKAFKQAIAALLMVFFLLALTYLPFMSLSVSLL